MFGSKTHEARGSGCWAALPTSGGHGTRAAGRAVSRRSHRHVGVTVPLPWDSLQVGARRVFAKRAALPCVNHVKGPDPECPSQMMELGMERPLTVLLDWRGMNSKGWVGDVPHDRLSRPWMECSTDPRVHPGSLRSLLRSCPCCPVEKSFTTLSAPRFIFLCRLLPP